MACTLTDYYLSCHSNSVKDLILLESRNTISSQRREAVTRSHNIISPFAHPVQLCSFSRFPTAANLIWGWGEMMEEMWYPSADPETIRNSLTQERPCTRCVCYTLFNFKICVNVNIFQIQAHLQKRGRLTLFPLKEAAQLASANWYQQAPHFNYGS